MGCAGQTQSGEPEVASPSATVRFADIADSRGKDNGVNTEILSEIVQAIKNDRVDFVIVGGDLVTGSKDPKKLESQLMNWREILEPLYSTGVRILPARGNHDVGDRADGNQDQGARQAWDNVFTGSYALPDNGPEGEKNITFSYTKDNVFVVGLDMYVTPWQINQVWLDEQFAANDQPHVFVFGHEPAFKVRHNDCLDDRPAARDLLWESMIAEGSRFFFAGHDHFYDHSRMDDGDGNPDNDVHQMIVTSGAPLYRDGEYDGENGRWTPTRIKHLKQYGYVLVEIDGLDATLTHKSRTGENVFEADDVFTYRAGAPEDDG